MTADTSADAPVRTRRGASAERPQKRRTGRRVRRLLILTHRWLLLVLGLILLVITLSGAVLLDRPEIQRALNHDAYATSGEPARIGLAQARQTALDAHPTFAADSVWVEHGVLRVTDYETSWTVDPGTGKILGHVSKRPRGSSSWTTSMNCFLSSRNTPGTSAC